MNDFFSPQKSFIFLDPFDPFDPNLGFCEFCVVFFSFFFKKRKKKKQMNIHKYKKTKKKRVRVVLINDPERKKADPKTRIHRHFCQEIIKKLSKSIKC
jgi:hypothetical protein